MANDDRTAPVTCGPRQRDQRRRLRLHMRRAGSLAIGTVAVITVGLAAPAAAAIPDGGGWVPPKTTAASPAGETPAQRAERQLGEAVEQVRSLLSNGGCAGFIGRWPNDFPETASSQSALEVFNQIVEARNPRQLHNNWFEEDGTAWAAGGRLPGEGPVVVVYRPFHEGTLPEYAYNTYTHENSYVLTAEQARALVLLHELRHVQGTSDGTHNGDLAAENEAVIDSCLPQAIKVPNPTYIRAPHDPVPTSPPLPDPPNLDGAGPLPESDDPVVDFGSEGPEITGDDGGTLDGGDVGAAYGDPTVDDDFESTDDADDADDGCEHGPVVHDLAWFEETNQD